MVGGGLKPAVSSMMMKEAKQEEDGKGSIKVLQQEKAEKMVKGSLGSILQPAGGGGGGVGDQVGVKRREGLTTLSEKPQQQKQQQQALNTGSNKAPRQMQQQQQQMANKQVKPAVLPTQLKSAAAAPKTLNGALTGGRLPPTGAELAMEKRRKMLEGLSTWHSSRTIR